MIRIDAHDLLLDLIDQIVKSSWILMNDQVSDLISGQRIEDDSIIDVSVQVFEQS